MAGNKAPARPIILVAQDALESATADATKFAGRSERGGILLGLRRGPHLHVNEVTLPMFWDRASFFSFRRSAAGHQAVALKRWKKSKHKVDWVGEWHSHPEPFPSPSSIDLASWQEITSERAAPMVFVILGYCDIWMGLCLPGIVAPVRYREVERSGEGVAFEPER